MINDKIRQLQEEIAAEQKRMSNCKHEFDKPFYNPTKEMVADGYRYTGRGGSDPEMEATGYHEQTKDRWTRKCTICGYEEHTDKQVAVIQSYQPKFF